jgi:L-ascorbate metabolism protein UlaG (beta-lactamase superfamily)
LGTWIDHPGHTSFIVTRGGLRLLFDPLLVRQDLDCRQPTCPRWLQEDLASVSAVFISHGHDDHLHPPSLLGLPQDTPVYFLDEDAETCSCDTSPPQLLAGLGFRDLRPFRPGQVISLAEEVRIHILPARNSSEGEEQCGFLIETPDVLALNAVDLQDSPTTRSALEPYRGRLDVAFVPTGASLQWQGFWNQMDMVEALGLCQWLRPALVASCGGSASLAERPRPGTLERYPHDWADWVTTAQAHLEKGQLLSQRPPVRLHYEAHRLQRTVPLQPGTRFQPGGAAPRPHALLTTFFGGYHPRFPTRKLCWPRTPLAAWLEPLQPLREAVQSAQGDLRHLLKRCEPSANFTPAGVLAPCTVRRLQQGNALELAARLCALIPPVPSEPEALELSFFAVAECLVENAVGPSEAFLPELRTCLWIDRRMFQLRTLAMQMKGLATYPPREAERLRAEHLELLRKTASQRRPVLTPHHFWLGREQVSLLTGAPSASEVAALLCFPGHDGVNKVALNELEALMLERCDGRPLAALTAELSEALELPAAEVDAALLGLLTRLSYCSVALFDWSQG